jgi:hypothetical protein
MEARDLSNRPENATAIPAVGDCLSCFPSMWSAPLKVSKTKTSEWHSGMAHAMPVTSRVRFTLGPVPHVLEGMALFDHAGAPFSSYITLQTAQYDIKIIGRYRVEVRVDLPLTPTARQLLKFPHTRFLAHLKS